MPAEPTYTYSSNPATDNKDAVRALLADTNRDAAGWMLSDEEILWLLSQEGSPLMAAAAGAEMIQGQFTGPARNIAILRIGDLMTESGGARGGGSPDSPGTWAAYARMLRKRVARGAMPIAGGIDVSDRQPDRSDTDTLQPTFTRGMDDFRNSGPQGSDSLDGLDGTPL